MEDAIVVFDDTGFINAIFQHDEIGLNQFDKLKKTGIVKNFKILKIDKAQGLKAETKIRFLVGPNFRIQDESQIEDLEHAYLRIVDDKLVFIALSDEMKLRAAKLDLKRQVLNYNSSSEQKEVKVNGKSYRLRKETRLTMLNRYQKEKEKNISNTYFFDIPCKIETAMQLLDNIDDYLTQCYDITNIILSRIDDCQSMNEVLSFDFIARYPETPNYCIQDET